LPGQKDETIVQVHGIGPFSSTLVDPVYELTEKGVFVLTSLLQAGTPTRQARQTASLSRSAAQVHGDRGEGVVIGRALLPVQSHHAILVREPGGDRFWATLPELKQ